MLQVEGSVKSVQMSMATISIVWEYGTALPDFYTLTLKTKMLPAGKTTLVY